MYSSHAGTRQQDIQKDVQIIETNHFVYSNDFSVCVCFWENKNKTFPMQENDSNELFHIMIDHHI